MTMPTRTRAPLPGAESNPHEIIHFALEAIAGAIPAADKACVCSFVPSTGEIEVIASLGRAVPCDYERLSAIFAARLQDEHTSTEARLIGTEVLAGTGFESGLFFPLLAADQVIGMLGLLSVASAAFSAEDAGRAALHASMIRVVLENFYLYEVAAHSMVVTHSVMRTAQSIADDPSPQHLINVLCDFLFDTHVSLSTLMLYGPVREDRPNGPFDHLVIRGSWTRRRGSSIALGTRIYLQHYPNLLRRLDNREIVVIGDVRASLDQFDPYARSLLRAERVAALAIVPLHAARRKLGVMLVGTDRPHEFSQQELDTYRTVSEFLAISTIADLVQQQHDLVQQGRAALLEAVTDGVLMALPDAAGGRVLTVNQRFAHYFGPTETLVQGHLLGDVLKQMQLPEDVRTSLRRQWFSVPINDSSTYAGSFHMIHSGGHPLDMEWYSAPVYRDRRVLGRIFIFHDVTAERMAARLRSAFISRVSHELRTPLTSIQGFAQFIVEEEGENLPPLARDYIEIILNSARSLKVMFSDMIELTRADAGELKLMLTAAHLPDVILEAVVRLELQYKAREQQMRLDLDDDLPLVQMDVDRIGQVISNLVANAIKYAPPGSTIRVSTTHITAPTDLPPGTPGGVMLPCVLVRVEDEGAGIAEADIHEVFLPFFRTQWAKANKIEGSGLGLAIARSIIELHRGQIWVEPATDARPGGRFLFTLPTL